MSRPTDPEPTLGHATKLRWNTTDDWTWSTDAVHEALITREDFDRAQHLMAAAGRRPVVRKPHRSRHADVFKGLMWCGHCTRRMQGHWVNAQPYYRCRYPAEYALANKIDHPSNVYLREAVVLDPIDTWLAQVFAPSRARPPAAASPNATTVCPATAPPSKPAPTPP